MDSPTGVGLQLRVGHRPGKAGRFGNQINSSFRSTAMVAVRSRIPPAYHTGDTVATGKQLPICPGRHVQLVLGVLQRLEVATVIDCMIQPLWIARLDGPDS